MKSKKGILILEAGGACAISCIKLLKGHPSLFLLAADMDEYAPGLAMCDKGIIVPPASDRNYKDSIQSIINSFSVDLVLPCFEHGFKELRDIKCGFITDFESAILCKDKLMFSKMCKYVGLPVPETKLLDTRGKVIDFPQYIKPRFGVGSRNNYKVETLQQLKLLTRFLNGQEEYIIQDYLMGDHWNVDVLVKEGQFLRAVPRRDIKQKEGNCITVEVRDYKKLINFSKVVQEKLNIGSPFNLEVFETEKGFVINEINVRFGGGIIFSALCGVDMVSFIATGEVRFLGNVRPGIYTRYYEEINIKIQKSE